jgi:hypothetical protein
MSRVKGVFVILVHSVLHFWKKTRAFLSHFRLHLGFLWFNDVAFSFVVTLLTISHSTTTEHSATIKKFTMKRFIFKKEIFFRSLDIDQRAPLNDMNPVKSEKELKELSDFYINSSTIGKEFYSSVNKRGGDGRVVEGKC